MTHSLLVAPLCRCSFEAGIASKGGSIANCGLATTPAMFFSCVATGHMYDGGVMVTASHLPWNRNGLKFFTKHGGAPPLATLHHAPTTSSSSELQGGPRTRANTPNIPLITAQHKHAHPHAGLDKMDIRWILEEAATDCFRTGLEVGNALFDPAYVIDAARSVPPSAVVQSNFMEAYAASLRSAIIQGVEVRPLVSHLILNVFSSFFTLQLIQAYEAYVLHVYGRYGSAQRDRGACSTPSRRRSPSQA